MCVICTKQSKTFCKGKANEDRGPTNHILSWVMIETPLNHSSSQQETVVALIEKYVWIIIIMNVLISKKGFIFSMILSFTPTYVWVGMENSHSTGFMVGIVQKVPPIAKTNHLQNNQQNNQQNDQQNDQQNVNETTNETTIKANNKRTNKRTNKTTNKQPTKQPTKDD